MTAFQDLRPSFPMLESVATLLTKDEYDKLYKRLSAYEKVDKRVWGLLEQVRVEPMPNKRRILREMAIKIAEI